MRTPSLSLIGNNDKMQPLPSYMVRSTGKTYNEIDILMVDSPVPFPGLAKVRIWRSPCLVLASKLRRCVRKTTILTKTIDKSHAQRHTPGSRDKTDYDFHFDGWRTFTCLAPSDGPNIMAFERQPIGDHWDGAYTVIELDRK